MSTMLRRRCYATTKRIDGSKSVCCTTKQCCMFWGQAKPVQLCYVVTMMIPWLRILGRGIH
jgi:hypothetical protein